MSESYAKPHFLCDAMLGSLARWLRLCGYDCLYLETEPEDAELARIAKNGKYRCQALEP